MWRDSDLCVLEMLTKTYRDAIRTMTRSNYKFEYDTEHSAADCTLDNNVTVDLTTHVYEK